MKRPTQTSPFSTGASTYRTVPFALVWNDFKITFGFAVSTIPRFAVAGTLALGTVKENNPWESVTLLATVGTMARAVFLVARRSKETGVLA